MCCCTRLHRHQIHLISYGIVSAGLITTGLVFTVFAIFQKESQIGKVWLAGPTTMVVGLVLAGKVVIDWGPAMLHAREGSIDSRLFDQLSQPAQFAPEPLRHPQMRIEHEPKCNGTTCGGNMVQYNHSSSNTTVHSPIGGYSPHQQPTTHHYIHSPMSENGIPRMVASGSGRIPKSSMDCIPRNMEMDHSMNHHCGGNGGGGMSMHDQHCMIYSQYNSPLNKFVYHNNDRSYSIPRQINNHPKCHSPRRSRPSLSYAYSNHHPSTHYNEHTNIPMNDQTCECTQYGSMLRRTTSPPSSLTNDSCIGGGGNGSGSAATTSSTTNNTTPTPTQTNAPYQGESFVLNERSYLI